MLYTNNIVLQETKLSLGKIAKRQTNEEHKMMTEELEDDDFGGKILSMSKSG